MASRKVIVERELGVRIPEQYAIFLDKYGIFESIGIEVYGISDDVLRYDGIPSVIGATKNMRRRENLPHRFLALFHSGYEDEVMCLDTEDEKVYSVSRVFGTRKFADSFDEWFEKDIIQYIKERDERRKRSGRKPERIIYLD
jgi:hypothetical protein